VSILDGRLPASFRNPNFARAGAEWFVLAGLLLAATLAVNSAYRWIAAALCVGSAMASAFYFLSWRHADLEVTREGVAVGGVFRQHSLTWGQIVRFEIREPARRTLFMLAFHWWADQATVRLVDGSRLRVRALEPWHGFTAISYFAITRHTKSDEAVDRLNDLLRDASRTDRSRPS
jgi:hypothetical protein